MDQIWALFLLVGFAHSSSITLGKDLARANKEMIYMYILGASEFTANLYCNCVHLYWEGWVQYIFAVIYGTLCSILIHI